MNLSADDKVVVDTNVLLVANCMHADVSDDCVLACIDHLEALKRNGVVVTDDGYRILSEYQHKTNASSPKGVGDVFLKWLLQNQARSDRVHQVHITEVENDCFVEFPDDELQQRFDPPDRKFPAVAHAHPDDVKPTIWQATDCKWLDWWPVLHEKGVRVKFLSPTDVMAVYRNKFPDRPVPGLPSQD